MSHVRKWFDCVGAAVKNSGLRALTGARPFGEVLHDVARDAHEVGHILFLALRDPTK